jgi:hypothetical protein
MGLGRLIMRVLLRVAAALLIAVPLLVVLVMVFTLAGRRRASPSLESGISHSLERGASIAPAIRASQVLLELSH